MSSGFDFCLLLYVIRLAGWLKHCSLSLSSVSLSFSLSPSLWQTCMLCPHEHIGHNVCSFRSHSLVPGEVIASASLDNDNCLRLYYSMQATDRNASVTCNVGVWFRDGRGWFSLDSKEHISQAAYGCNDLVAPMSQSFTCMFTDCNYCCCTWCWSARQQHKLLVFSNTNSLARFTKFQWLLHVQA